LTLVVDYTREGLPVYS